VTDTTPTTTRPASRPPDEAARWAEVRRVADLLDSRFRIPGTRQTFGVDAILGVVPGIGDIAGLVASSLVVGQAARLGARGWTLVRMLLTMTLDAVVGSIPFAGTVFDVRSLAAVVAATVIAALLVVAVLVWLLRTLF
jgi:hypothetical protein